MESRREEINKIKKLILNFYDITEIDFFSYTRREPIAMARQIFFYCLRENFNFSFPAIGRIFNKDHTTIIYAYQKIKKEISKDSKLNNFISTLLVSKELMNLDLFKDNIKKDSIEVNNNDLIPEKKDDIFHILSEKQKELVYVDLPIHFNSGYLEKVFSLIDKRNGDILKIRYGFKGDDLKTLDEIGRDNSISRERVRQIINQALKSLIINNYRDLGHIIYLIIEKVNKHKLISVENLLKEIFNFSYQDKNIVIKYLLMVIYPINNIKRFNLSNRMFLIDINFEENILQEIDHIKSLVRNIESNIPELILIRSKKDYILEELKRYDYFLDKPQFLDSFFLDACYDNYLFESEIIIYERENFEKYEISNSNKNNTSTRENIIRGIPKEYNIFFE